MNKTSQWAKALNESTETLKTTISNNEAQSTKEIAEILRNASQERLNTIKSVINENKKELRTEYGKFATLRTWQCLLPLIPFLLAAGFSIWAYVAYQSLSGYQEQKEQWDMIAPKAYITKCELNGKNPRVCVRVDPAMVKFTDPKGNPLMILDGY